MCELIPFCQDGFSRDGGEGVREAVSKVQSGRMTSFSILAVGDARSVGLIGIESDYLDASLMQKKVELASCDWRRTIFKYDSRFYSGASGDKSLVSGENEVQKTLTFHLIKKNGK